ncbi:MAG: NAD-dependent epimerase/dehydratase family protein [Gorillibacterium sp.]|nr:NAD-dependent epimerase/dehydratase family protein [Gorillibacterium sp.]
MKIILTGATGFVGGEVLRQALDDPAIDLITVLTRRSVGMSNPKLKEIILKDFLDYSRITDHLKVDACIWCLGISQTEVSKEEYIKITFDYTLAAARAMLAANPRMRFCFLSGRAADQDEKSISLYGKIKGRTEKELSKLSPSVYNFRPAFIRPARPGQKRPFIPMLFGPIAWVVDHFTEDFSVDSGILAHWLLGVAKAGADQSVINNRSIRQPYLSDEQLP